MIFDFRKLNARWVLGWALAKHLLVRLFAGRRDPNRWLGRLAQEKLGRVPPRAWELFAGASRCIGCALCDSVGAPEDAPSRWIQSIARQPADAVLVHAELDRLATLAPAIEQICPARVAVSELVALVRENRRMLGDR